MAIRAPLGVPCADHDLFEEQSRRSAAARAPARACPVGAITVSRTVG
ncbi:hypothetical protein ACIQ8D_18655 [Streptomyces sp. NPDC096094]